MTRNVIIVAGGKGLRMGNEVPKQFVPIGRNPILMHTIRSFYEFDHQIHIIVVLPETHREYWQKICKGYGFSIPHTVIEGGETRFHSVRNGLKLVEEGIVAVHDGARPFASVDLIRRMFDLVAIHKAVIPVIDVTDSLRKVAKNGNSEIIDRSKIKQVQTPQLFDTELLKKAYKAEYSDLFTDDASVVEAFGEKIHLAEGEVTNIKITTPFDLEIAKVIIDSRKEHG